MAWLTNADSQQQNGSIKIRQFHRGFIKLILSKFLFVNIAQKMKFSIKDFFSNCDQIRSFLRIWSQLLKKSIMENLICAVLPTKFYCLISFQDHSETNVKINYWKFLQTPSSFKSMYLSKSLLNIVWHILYTSLTITLC